MWKKRIMWESDVSELDTWNCYTDMCHTTIDCKLLTWKQWSCGDKSWIVKGKYSYEQKSCYMNGRLYQSAWILPSLWCLYVWTCNGITFNVMTSLVLLVPIGLMNCASKTVPDYMGCNQGSGLNTMGMFVLSILKIIHWWFRLSKALHQKHRSIPPQLSVRYWSKMACCGWSRICLYCIWNILMCVMHTDALFCWIKSRLSDWCTFQ